MKTVEEMKAKLAEQQATYNAARSESVAAFKAQWIVALDGKMEAAWESKGPVEEVSVKSNELEASTARCYFPGAGQIAACLVQDHFCKLGFNCHVDLGSGLFETVSVSWGAD
jgi:hypothetical protein